MRDADEAVEKLLRSLRNAEPGADLKQRIITAIQQATPARESTKAGRRRVQQPVLWTQRLRHALAVPMAGVAVLAVVLVLIVTSHQYRSALPAMSSQPAPADASQPPKPGEVVQGPTGKLRHTPSVAHVKRVMTRAHSHQSFAAETSASISYPAPPLPLTDQERLLLRLARRHDPGSLTILNPEVRGAQMALTTKQFQQFFGLNEQEMRTQLE